MKLSSSQIGGAAQTINWQGGSAPTGNANGIDSFPFTILNDGGSYVVLGQMVDLQWLLLVQLQVVLKQDAEQVLTVVLLGHHKLRKRSQECGPNPSDILNNYIRLAVTH